MARRKESEFWRFKRKIIEVDTESLEDVSFKNTPRKVTIVDIWPEEE